MLSSHSRSPSRNKMIREICTTVCRQSLVDFLVCNMQVWSELSKCDVEVTEPNILRNTSDGTTLETFWIAFLELCLFILQIGSKLIMVVKIRPVLVITTYLHWGGSATARRCCSLGSPVTICAMHAQLERAVVWHQREAFLAHYMFMWSSVHPMIVQPSKRIQKLNQ